MKPRLETVTIPTNEQHEGIYKVSVCLKWVCPVCGEPRGEPHPVLSYDGSRRMIVHGWFNPCGHVDEYNDLRNEAINNGLNNRLVVVVPVDAPVSHSYPDEFQPIHKDMTAIIDAEIKAWVKP